MAGQEQKKPKKAAKPVESLSKPKSLGGTPPDPTDTLASIDETLGNIHVISGANDGDYTNLVGKSVGQSRKYLKDSFSIANEAQSVVNGKDVNEDYVLTKNDTLEFIKQAGVKGGKG